MGASFVLDASGGYYGEGTSNTKETSIVSFR